MRQGTTKYNMMPLPNRKIFDLVATKTDGNVRRFAELLGVKQQSFNRLFNPDPRNGKYPSVSVEIKEAIKSIFGFDEAWFVQEEQEEPPMMTVDDKVALLAEIERLKNVKLPTDKDKVMDIWLRFMENQRQYNEIMKEMAELYRRIKGE